MSLTPKLAVGGAPEHAPSIGKKCWSLPSLEKKAKCSPLLSVPTVIVFPSVAPSRFLTLLILKFSLALDM